VVWWGREGTGSFSYTKMGEEVGEGESFGCCRRPFIVLSEAITELLLMVSVVQITVGCGVVGAACWLL
jgi:hypothetical protein